MNSIRNVFNSVVSALGLGNQPAASDTGTRERPTILAGMLQQLREDLEALAESQDGTKEYYSHKACECYARALECVPREGTLSSAVKADLKNSYMEYARDDHGAGLAFEHPWPLRARIIREMYTLVGPYLD
jgi:hypothetical protein